MLQPISIGAIFVLAWQSLRQRFLPIMLLSLLQSCWAPMQTLWPYLPEGWNSNGAWQDGTSLACLLPFLVASMAIMLQVDGLENDRPGKVAILMRRFVPTLLAVLISLALLIAIGAALIFGLRFLPLLFYFGAWRLGLFLVMFVIMIALSVPLFLVLPAAVLETGGPLRAIGRSFALTRNQRWRIGAVLLIFTVLSIASTAVLFWASFTYGDPITANNGRDLPVLDIGAAVLWWLSTLTLTLLIASTYRLATRLRDGMPLVSLRHVFE